MYESYGYASGGPATDTFLAAYSWLILIAAWAYFGFMMYKVAHKTGNYPIAWWAFVPILNTILLIKMAAKPLWWFWLLLVPVVNIVAFFTLWMETAHNAGQSRVWGFLCVLPFVNLVSIFVLAYGGKKYTYPDAISGDQPKPRQPQQVG